MVKEMVQKCKNGPEMVLQTAKKLLCKLGTVGNVFVKAYLMTRFSCALWGAHKNSYIRWIKQKKKTICTLLNWYEYYNYCLIFSRESCMILSNDFLSVTLIVARLLLLIPFGFHTHTHTAIRWGKKLILRTSSNQQLMREIRWEWFEQKEEPWELNCGKMHKMLNLELDGLEEKKPIHSCRTTAGIWGYSGRRLTYTGHVEMLSGVFVMSMNLVLLTHDELKGVMAWMNRVFFPINPYMHFLTFDSDRNILKVLLLACNWMTSRNENILKPYGEGM